MSDTKIQGTMELSSEMGPDYAALYRDTLRKLESVLNENLKQQAEIKRLTDQLERTQGYEAKMQAEIERLRGMIHEAPHQMGCKSLQFHHESSAWGSIEKCDCWKIEALEAGDE